MSSSDKYRILKTQLNPEVDYTFPKGSDGRLFQHQWLQQFPWLVYSRKENGGYCLPCVLFSIGGYHSSEPGILVTRPLKNFKKAMDSLRKHSSKEHHQSSIVRREDFLKVMSNQQPAITSILSQATANQIAKNRSKMASIIKTIVLCGRQNISLRGHRDNLTDIERDTARLHNHGNFMALLDFRVDAGDTVLRDHLSQAPRNATYTSSIIQNQLIDILSKQVCQNIIDRVKVSKWFTVIADEVTDVSNMEILSLVVRYYNPDSLLPCEDLVGFFECNEGITGRQLANIILTNLQSFGLDLSFLRGQAYDGAGNMSGSIKGTAAIITEQHNQATYLHCASHCLNLVVVKSLQSTNVRNMMNIVGKVYIFFDAHPKRQKKLEDAITNTQPSYTINKLKYLYRTRWVQRLDAFSVFFSLPVCTCLFREYLS